MEVESVFIAKRRSVIVIFKSLIFSVGKVALSVILVYFGTSGILSAYYISALAGFAFTMLYFKYKCVIDFSLIRKMFRFSVGNYIAGIFIMLPSLVLPIMITNLIGPESTAYFYMAMMMAGLLFIIPGAVSRSLLAEGSHDTNDLNNKIKKAYLLNYSILTIGVVLLLLFGRFALSLFKPEYVMAYPLLIYFSISAYFLVINTIYGTMWNIKKLVRYVIFQNLIRAAFVTVVTSFLLTNNSIIIVSQIWLGGEILAVIFSVIIGMKK